MAATDAPAAPEPPVAERRMRIGEVAERVGLSLRPIRHYDDVGLVVPTARSEGGFRLYTEPDVARLELVKRMKPLGFTLEEMSDLLDVLSALEAREPGAAALIVRLGAFRQAAQERVRALRSQLTTAEGFERVLASTVDAHTPVPR